VVIGIKTLFPYERTTIRSTRCLPAASCSRLVFAPFYRQLFSSATSRFLGKISFPLYLVQIPLICSYSSFLFLRLSAHGLPIAKTADDRHCSARCCSRCCGGMVAVAGREIQYLLFRARGRMAGAFFLDSETNPGVASVA
jgi:hypothetical protein